MASVSRSTTGTYSATGNLITNGSFETNTTFDNATQAIKDSLRADGTDTGGTANSWQGTWAARPDTWIQDKYGVAGMPNGWTTTINGGAATTALAPNVGAVAVNPNDADFHGRWVRFDADGQGQAGGARRNADLGRSSLYFGTGATRIANVSSFGTPAANGVITVANIPGIAAADVTRLMNGQTGLGQATGGAALNSTISGANISQTVGNLTVNQQYKLSFWVSGEYAYEDNAGNTANLNHQYSNGAGMVGLTIGGLSGGGLATITNPLFLAVPDSNSAEKSFWYTVAFTATNASHTFTWTDYGHMDITPADAFSVASTAETIIDGIMLTPVPEPATYGLVFGVVTLGFVGVRRYRRSL